MKKYIMFIRFLLYIIFLHINIISVSQFYIGKEESLIMLPDKQGREYILNLINSAKKSVKIMMYKIQDHKIIDALINLKRSNVDVKIIMNHYDVSQTKIDISFLAKETFDKLSKNKEYYLKLKDNLVDIQLCNIDHFVSYHPKVIIIDDKQALIGTFNLNSNGFLRRNFGIITKNTKTVRDILFLFARDYNNLVDQNYQSSNIVCAPDNYLQFIYNLIDKAKNSIYIYQNMLGHKGICDKILEVAKNIKVRIIVTNEYYNTSKPEEVHYNLMRFNNHPNIEVKDLKKPYTNHAKIILIDPETVDLKCFLGSSLFWHEGFAMSREIGVLLKDKQCMEHIYKTFCEDWLLAKSIVWDGKDHGK